MKIIIAALASIAFATSAIAAVPLAHAKKQTIVKTLGQFELAAGKNRHTLTEKSKGPKSLR